jgi:hypothetical protein
MLNFELLGRSVLDLFEDANANRQRAARVRDDAARLMPLTDRLLARERAVAFDRRAAVLEHRAAEQISR